MLDLGYVITGYIFDGGKCLFLLRIILILQKGKQKVRQRDCQ